MHGVSVYGSSSVEGIIWLERESVLGRGWGVGEEETARKKVL